MYHIYTSIYGYIYARTSISRVVDMRGAQFRKSVKYQHVHTHAYIHIHKYIYIYVFPIKRNSITSISRVVDMRNAQFRKSVSETA